MPYLNIDDGMDEHPKVDGLSDEAFRLYVSSKLYCARTLTDGFLPLSKARRLTATGTDVVAKELVDADLWHDLGEGCDNDACVKERTCHKDGRAGHYIVHDYLQWNHSKHWWETRRAAEAERKKKWRKARKSGQTEDVAPSVPTGHDAGQDAGRDAPEPEPDPDTRTNPLVAPPAVDGLGSVTEIQTAREKRAQGDGSEGATA